MLMLQFTCVGGKELKVSYPCVVLNVMVAEHNTNDQYQTLVDAGAKRYETSSEMSIEFEVDGPYKVWLYLKAVGPFINFTKVDKQHVLMTDGQRRGVRHNKSVAR